MQARNFLTSSDQLLDADRKSLLEILDSQQASPAQVRSPIKTGEEAEPIDDTNESSPEEPDLAFFASVDDTGASWSFGPSSALNHQHESFIERTTLPNDNATVNHDMRNRLIANAALRRQQEPLLRSRPLIRGIPTDLALHLLDIHWCRQHHTFPLTYRPAIMRSLANDGADCPDFLLFAIFAWSSKLSNRIDVRDEPNDPTSAGRRFFKRCDQLLAEQSLLSIPTIPTIMGLLLLGSTHNANGESSKGWLYTGYALRMVFDLGLHIDPRGPQHSPEETEIRRRTFWAAFICDKLQSLYFGRPMAIDLHDAHVSREFYDTFEEYELWDPRMECMGNGLVQFPSEPVHSVSTFQQFCLLSRIMTKIIKKFYVVGASGRNAKNNLQNIESLLRSWLKQLPAELWVETYAMPSRYPTPNIMSLNATYHALIILLHRPFISHSHLRLTVAPEESWRKCTFAANNITTIVSGYRMAYTLRSAPYLLSYTLYVACTIHVRNAAMGDIARTGDQPTMLTDSLTCLDELCKANPGVVRPASIIRGLMARHGIPSQPAECTQNAGGTPVMDLDKLLSMFPNSTGAVHPAPATWGDQQQSINLAAGADGHGSGANVVQPYQTNSQTEPFVEFANFLDPLYGHLDGTMAPMFDLNGMQFGTSMD